MRSVRERRANKRPYCALPGSRLLAQEKIRRARLEHDIAAPPWRVVNQAPFVTGTGGVGCHQNVTWTNDECLTIASDKFECSSKRNNILALRRIVPVEARMWRRFLEVHSGNVGAPVQGQCALKHMRSIVLTCPKLDRTHGITSMQSHQCPARRFAALRTRRSRATPQWRYRRHRRGRRVPVRKRCQAAHA